MKYKILGDSDCPLVHIELINGETVKIENGAMAYLSNVELEGKMKDNVYALPIDSGKLRLYCLRLSDSVMVVGNGGQKKTKTYQDSEELQGYVISLQKLDELIKDAVRKGDIIIEEREIKGIDDKYFDL